VVLSRNSNVDGKMTDEVVDVLIELWKIQPLLCDVKISRYEDADDRNAVLARISTLSDIVSIVHFEFTGTTVTSR